MEKFERNKYNFIKLREISEENFQACINLDPNVEREEFVDPVIYSFAEAWLEYNNFSLFAIYCGEDIIGFVSFYIDEKDSQNPQIINFLIDKQFQNQGYGKEAIKLCFIYLKSNFQAKSVRLPVYKDNLRAIDFWEKRGFSPTGNIEDGYLWMRLYF